MYSMCMCKSAFAQYACTCSYMYILWLQWYVHFQGELNKTFYPQKSIIFYHLLCCASRTVLAFTCMEIAPKIIFACSCAANPIDLLAKYVNMTEDDVDIEIQEPYHLLRVGCLYMQHCSSLLKCVYACVCTCMHTWNIHIYIYLGVEYLLKRFCVVSICHVRVCCVS